LRQHRAGTGQYQQQNQERGGAKSAGAPEKPHAGVGHDRTPLDGSPSPGKMGIAAGKIKPVYKPTQGLVTGTGRLFSGKWKRR